jgi:adenylate cyclase
LRLARATSAIRTLDLTAARPLSGSHLRELDEAIRAYNALIATLHWFETYVPRRLVKQLMAQGERATALVERDVTVLFTDIVDFTSLAERLSASDAATFLNDHFRLLAACVEAEGGTIDKYIGDSLMAFWGAPELQLDHSARACRAARAIATAIVGDNRRRRGLGLPPTRIRIGIHAGPAMVGNIGAPGRINYTLVGDIVNTAQRIEDVAKKCMTDEDEAVILVSDAVLRSAGPECSAQPVGEHIYSAAGTRPQTFSDWRRVDPYADLPARRREGRRRVNSSGSRTGTLRHAANRSSMDIAAQHKYHRRDLPLRHHQIGR